MATNYGSMHMPLIVRYAGGKARSTVTLTGLDSAAIYLGGFVPFATGTDAAPSGAEFGIPAWTDDSRVYGFVVGFHRKDSGVPIQDDDQRQGTVTNATGELPMKYTFNASNDISNTTSAYLEQVEVMPIMPGDVLEVSLWGGGTTSVARGTTTAQGTTTSSANIGVGLPIDATYHFALTESSAAKLLANMDFVTTELRGKLPRRANRVYVECVRKYSSLTVPE